MKTYKKRYVNHLIKIIVDALPNRFENDLPTSIYRVLYYTYVFDNTSSQSYLLIICF